jgi:putative SOS response-associated peptidase YedK
MCGRYTLAADPAKIAERFSLDPQEACLPTRYNIAPGQDAPAIVNEERNRVRLLRWGLIPAWAKDATFGRRLINARAETLRDKPSFRGAFARRRCLIPADGFYEWRREPGQKRAPMRFALKSREPFAFAGLWESWRDPRGLDIKTFTIITTEANPLVRPHHPRMPVMLRPEAEAAWLDSGLTNPMSLVALLGPYPAESMEAYEVSALVNSPANDEPACAAPF